MKKESQIDFDNHYLQIDSWSRSKDIFLYLKNHAIMIIERDKNMEKEKKFYELTEEERQEKMKHSWKKIKPYVKKGLFALFCIAICLLMIFGLLSGMFSSKNSTSESAAIIAKLFSKL